MSDYESDDAAMLDRVRAERDALREENERLKADHKAVCGGLALTTKYRVAAEDQLAEAVKVIERIFEICDETDELNGKRLAREFLAKVKA